MVLHQRNEKIVAIMGLHRKNAKKSEAVVLIRQYPRCLGDLRVMKKLLRNQLRGLLRNPPRNLPRNQQRKV